LDIETSDAKTSYKLKTPKAMHGKDYVFSVQAINKLQKMSLVSDQAIFSVADPSKPAVVHKTSSS
jgi:hypothetical protein